MVKRDSVMVVTYKGQFEGQFELADSGTVRGKRGWT
jgi:hypothetical protein